jgi:hypothetical protein
VVDDEELVQSEFVLGLVGRWTCEGLALECKEEEA